LPTRRYCSGGPARWPTHRRTARLHHFCPTPTNLSKRCVRIPVHRRSGKLMSAHQLSPVELEVARNRLKSISEEIGSALIRTSYSHNIKDRRDCSAGIYMPNGELISQAEHIPLHLGLMPTLIAKAMEEYGLENILPGDVLMTNNPYLGGSHLPDMCVISPIFIGTEMVAVVANMAHHVDVGGMTPGSMATHSTEIFQEGVRVPTVRLYAEGQLQHEVLSLLLTNIRTADKTRGDLM